MRKDLKLFKIVYDFLEQLTDEQLKLLVSDKAKLQLEIAEKTLSPTELVPLQMPVPLEEIRTKLENFSSREEATAYLEQLSLHKRELKAIAENNNIPLSSKETNEQMIKTIVENTVGAKLKFDALLNIDLKRKY